MKLAVILFVTVWLAVICVAAADSGHPQLVAAHHVPTVEDGGSKTGAKHGEHKHSKKSEKKSVHDEEKGHKGETLKEEHKSEEEEGGGKKLDHNSEGSYGSHKKAGGGSQHGAKFQDGAKHSKANSKKGFREKYHKDEEKNLDTFYSSAHKSGEYKVFGKKHAKHSAHSGAKKHVDVHKSGKAEGAHGKSGKKAGAQAVEDKKGYKGQKATKTHHQHNEKWGKKGGKSGGKQYHYDAPAHHK